ncbi:MAG TPA: YfiR family protein [Usitatibacteraceae bacterium]
MESGMARAQESSLEYAIKGAYLFKFGDFVEWPETVFAQPNAPFVIGILGEDPFGPNLDQSLRNRSVQGRPIVIKRYERVEEARSAQILYLGQGLQERKEAVLAELRKTNTLTVSDKYRQAGAMINFVLEENKVRFEIDAAAAQQAGLKISSKLLSLAKARGKNE